MTRARRHVDEDSRAGRSIDDERVDGLLDRARIVLGDSRCRLALPTERAEGVQERPFSDCCFGFAYCAATFAALGVADGVIKAALGPATPFMIGAWGSLGVLAFGTMDAPPLRLWNVVVATTASASVSIIVVRALGATWLARALSLSLSLVVMMRAGAIHPPAGAVALAAMDAHFHSLGYLFAIYPTLVGSAFILGMSRLCHATKRRFEFEFSDVVRVVTGPFRASSP